MLKATLAEPAIANRKIVSIALDLRSQDSIKACFERAVNGLGKIDLLVNNAGRALVRPSVDVTDAEWDDVIDTNLKGVFFLSQLFGRRCIERKRPGAIVSMKASWKPSLSARMMASRSSLSVATQSRSMGCTGIVK